MEKKFGQFILQYATETLSCTINLFSTRGGTLAEVVLAGTAETGINLITTVIIAAITECQATEVIINIDDLTFYDQKIINEANVGGVVTLVSFTIDQGASAIVITDDQFFRDTIRNAFAKHKRYSRLTVLSKNEAVRVL